MATFSQVLNSKSNSLKYRTVKCPDAMAEAIKPFIKKGWRTWRDISKSRYSGFKVTLGICNTYSVRLVTISESGEVTYQGREQRTSYIHNENIELLSRLTNHGIDIKKAKEIIADLSKY